MATYYEGNAIYEFEQSITKKDYYMSIYAENQHYYIFIVMFVIISFMYDILINFCLDGFSIAFLPIILLAIIIYMFFSSKCEKEYRENFIMKEKTTVKIYRDSFEMINEYKNFKGHWSEARRCIELKDGFVILDCYENENIFIKKNENNAEQLSKFFALTFAKRYKKVKNPLISVLWRKI